MSISRDALIWICIHVPNVTKSLHLPCQGKSMWQGNMGLDLYVWSAVLDLIQHPNWQSTSAGVEREQGPPLLSTNLSSAAPRVEYRLSLRCNVCYVCRISWDNCFCYFCVLNTSLACIALLCVPEDFCICSLCSMKSFRNHCTCKLSVWPTAWIC